jgi:hypothetical protein
MKTATEKIKCFSKAKTDAAVIPIMEIIKETTRGPL